ncbi:MAG TPA: hypothetical protein VN844_18025, partial [Pyrinomonadaceae bacterium]|nr:hypothetical protein [Pyrinomonadaceae bacterium]
MKSLTQKSARQFVGAGVRVVALALILVVFGSSAALAVTRAYVANNMGQSVSVIDTATNSLVTTIPLGVIVTPVGPP